MVDATPDPIRVRAMFARIVASYDRANRLMTFGRDRAWRRAAVDAVYPTDGARALDLGCGTGDLTLEMADSGARLVVALDPVPEMLAASVEKAVGRSRIAFVAGDALALPFPDERFDCVVSAFVLRNLADLPAALAEIRRVLRPGGRIGLLELTPLTLPVVGPLFRLYFRNVAPLIGGWLSGNADAYRYLPASVERFPSAHALAGLLAGTRFRKIRYRRFMLGTVALHVAER